MTTARTLCRVLFLAVGVLSTGAGSGAAAASAAAVTLKAADEFMQAGESLPVHVIFENPSTDVLTDVQFMALPTDSFVIERLPGEAAAAPAPPGAVIVAGFRVRSAAGLRPGKYTVLFDVRYRRRGKQGPAGSVRLIKDFTVEVRSPLQAGITPPTVTITVKPSSDTLRETSQIQLRVLVENKSPLPLEHIQIGSLRPPVLDLDPATPVQAQTIAPYGTWTHAWNVSLKSPGSPSWSNLKSWLMRKPAADEGPRYGKHTLFFDTTYQWNHGAAQFTSRTITPVEISASFLGSEGFSQVFGVPLSLIVFVLPGFCLLFAYRGLSAVLLKEGDTFTPTSKDGIFYSVVWSVVLIFVYRGISGTNLYAFFTSADLVAVNAIGALAGAVVPVARAVTREYRRKAEAGLRFSEEDGELAIVRKALARRPDPATYEEGSVKEGDVEWAGVILSRAGEPVVLGPQLTIVCTRDVARDLEAAKPRAGGDVDDFLTKLSALVASHAVTIEATKPRRREKGVDTTHARSIKVLGVTPLPESKGTIDLIEFRWRDGG